MSPPIRKTLLKVIFFVFFFSSIAISAPNQADADNSDTQDITTDNALSPRSSVPESVVGTSRRFQVKEVRISGNNMISTDELLAELPEFYIVTKQKDDTAIQETYDFGVLREVIQSPGQQREVSLKAIQGFTEYLLSIYQAKGYAGIYVYVPAEAVEEEANLQDGILPITIIEGRVEQITIKRFDFDRQEQQTWHLKDSAIKSWSPVKEGDVINKKNVDEYVRLLNVNPDRYVSPVVLRSDKPDFLNLRYDVYEANPWHWYVQVDNAGTEDRRWSPRVGMVNTNFTGIDDRLAVMYQAQPDSMLENYALFANYELPVFSPRLRLGAYAGYTEFDITPSTGAGINFLGNGWFYGGTLRYNVFQMSDWLFDFMGTISHEESKVTPSLGVESNVEMNLWGIGAEIHRAGDMSTTSFSFNVQNSFGVSSNIKFQNARMNSNPDFTIYTASLLHKQFMDEDKIHELSGTFRGIFPDERLIPAKMTPFGGLYTVRGYKENSIVADGGIIASLQYRFDLTKCNDSSFGAEQGSHKNKAIWPPNVSLVAFTDYAVAQIKDNVVGEIDSEELWSAGGGTIVEVKDSFDAMVYYAWPLESVPGTSSGDGRLHLSFIYRW